MSVNDTTEKRFESDIEAFLPIRSGRLYQMRRCVRSRGPVPRYTNSIHPDISAEGMAVFC